eukprot:COSAG01_NODE_64080_length_277_cov_39.539326_1_plen_47_part_01
MGDPEPKKWEFSGTQGQWCDLGQTISQTLRDVTCNVRRSLLHSSAAL